MPAQLVALSEGPSILLDKPILLLGRHPECDIVIDSRKISRRHCCIAQVADYLVVRDLGSTNGIRINGVRVLEGRIGPGDEVTIGNNRYQVRWDGAGAPVPSRPREAVPPALPAQAVDDALLESSDEPIPLAEPGGRRTGLQRAKPVSPPAAPALPAPPGAADEAEDDVPPSPVPPEPEPLVLPDHLELAPNSDVFPRAASDSHPPA